MKYEDLPAQHVPEFLTQPEVVVLDIRDAHSFNQDHIQNAQPANDAVISRLLRNKQQQPPILVYCYHGHSSRDMVSFLCGLGFNNVYNLEGGWQAWNTFIATREMETREATATLPADLAHWLVQSGFDAANLHSRIDNGMSALMVAALEDELDIAQALLAAGADVNLLNDDENNALWFACVRDNLDMLRLLASHAIAIDNQNVNGATCLVYAASAGKMDVVRTLMDLGANPCISTLDGFNALDSAATLPILRFLKPHFAAA